MKKTTPEWFSQATKKKDGLVVKKIQGIIKIVFEIVQAEIEHYKFCNPTAREIAKIIKSKKH